MRSKSGFTTLVLLESRESYLEIRVRSPCTFGVQALTPVAIVDQVPTMRFVPPSFQIGSGPNFEIPVGLFRPAPGFLAALEPRQVNRRARINSRLRSLRRIFTSSPLRLPGHY